MNDSPLTPKATVVSPSNIAFIKYWGARDLERAIPENASLSMTLDRCSSRTTVEHLPNGSDREGSGHEIRWRGSSGSLVAAPPSFADRVAAHLDRLRDWAGCGGAFRVATENSFPAAAGIASSASGFSALTLAVLESLGRQESDEVRSELSRLSGSGSASRSVLGGYVEWPASSSSAPKGSAGPVSYAAQVASAEHWDLRDVITIVESGPKDVSSLDGHKRARTSPYFEKRLQDLPARLDLVRRAIAARDFEILGPEIEREAIDLHMIAMTSRPAIFYWQPPTLAVLAAVRALRADGVAAFSTLDAGANVHVICRPEDEAQVADRLRAVQGVERLILDRVGQGPRVEAEHLF
ncbi:MAG: diphosphomevalonate decarboxylase [Acidobacteriota bacterium]